MIKRFALISLFFLAACGVNESKPTPTVIGLPNQATLIPPLVITEIPPATSTTVPLATLPATTVPPTEQAALATPIPAAQVRGGNGGLRLRNLPSEGALVLGNLDEFAILYLNGRLADNSWVAVQTTENQNGWVATAYLDIFVDLNSLPIIPIDPASLPSPLPPTAAPIVTAPPAEHSAPLEVAAAVLPADGQGVVSVEGNELRLREQPSTNSAVLANLPNGTQVDILGKNQDGTWLNVSTPKGSGWVYASYILTGVNLNALAIPESAYVPTPIAFVPPTNAAASGGISGISSNASRIFVKGQGLGNRPDVFSKVGDSITATGHFLYPFGWGQYQLHGYAYFQEVINFFSQTQARESISFSNGSMSAKPYWTSSTVLDPSQSEKPPCEANEPPLVCEYRIVRPSLALIMIGTNDIGQHSAAQFQANLQRIVQISIDMGVIPVLSTLPPRVGKEGDVNQFNQIIINTARGFDVPLWDYYNAMLKLPNQGLDGDGVHPSWQGGEYSNYTPSGTMDDAHLQYGFALRNLMALQVLDSVWRQVIAPNAGIAVSATGSNTAFLDPNLLSIPSANPVAAAPAAGGACSGAPPPRLSVGGTGRVTPGEPNNFRSAPSNSAAKIGAIPGGAVFVVLEGPVCADGMSYWKVNYNGSEGWTAEGRGSTYWLEPL